MGTESFRALRLRFMANKPQTPTRVRFVWVTGEQASDANPGEVCVGQRVKVPTRVRFGLGCQPG